MMSNVEEFPSSARRLTEYEALVAAAPTALDAIPGAVYVCDHDGWLVLYNTEAAEFWGRAPVLSGGGECFCGSHRLFLVDKTPLPHEDCAMAAAVRTGTATRNAEVMIERSDGSRFIALVNIVLSETTTATFRERSTASRTFRLAMEEEVRRKSRDLEDFFENSAIGLHIVSGEGIVLRANKAELDLLGYRAEEYVGRHIAEFHADAPVIGEILHRLCCGQRLDRHPARLRARTAPSSMCSSHPTAALRTANTSTRTASPRM